MEWLLTNALHIQYFDSYSKPVFKVGKQLSLPVV